MGCSSSSAQMKKHEVLEDVPSIPSSDYVPNPLEKSEEIDICLDDEYDAIDFQWTLPDNNFKVCEVDGEWKGESAGGSRNWPTFLTNPQFLLDLTATPTTTTEGPPLGDDDFHTIGGGLLDVSVSLTQTSGSNPLHIALFIYKTENENRLSDGDCDLSSPAGDSGAFVNWRQVRHLFRLSRGKYVVLPAVFRPGAEARFTLAVLAPPPASLRPL